MAVTGRGETRVNSTTAGDQHQPSMTVLKDGRWVVTWTSTGAASGVYQQLYDAKGQPIGHEVRVNATLSGTQSNSSITTLSDGGWIVSWTLRGQNGPAPGIYLQRYD